MCDKTIETVDERESKEQSPEDITTNTAEVTEILSAGFMQAFISNLEMLQERLNELTQNQGILIETMQQENAKFSECQAARNLAVMLSYVRAYHVKLERIILDMDTIDDKVARLKRRALKLRFQKEKEELSKAEARERQLELERHLTAKVAPEHKQL